MKKWGSEEKLGTIRKHAEFFSSQTQVEIIVKDQVMKKKSIFKSSNELEYEKSTIQTSTTLIANSITSCPTSGNVIMVIVPSNNLSALTLATYTNHSTANPIVSLSATTTTIATSNSHNWTYWATYAISGTTTNTNFISNTTALLSNSIALPPPFKTLAFKKHHRSSPPTQKKTCQNKSTNTVCNVKHNSDCGKILIQDKWYQWTDCDNKKCS